MWDIYSKTSTYLNLFDRDLETSFFFLRFWMWDKTSEVLVGHAEVFDGKIHVWVGNTKIPQFWMGGPSHHLCDLWMMWTVRDFPQRSSSGNVVKRWSKTMGYTNWAVEKPHRMTILGWLSMDKRGIFFLALPALPHWICKISGWGQRAGSVDTPQERSQVPESELWSRRSRGFVCGPPSKSWCRGWTSACIFFPAGVQDIHPTRTIEDRHRNNRKIMENATGSPFRVSPPGITPSIPQFYVIIERLTTWCWSRLIPLACLFEYRFNTLRCGVQCQFREALYL